MSTFCKKCQNWAEFLKIWVKDVKKFSKFDEKCQFVKKFQNLVKNVSVFAKIPERDEMVPETNDAMVILDIIFSP